MREKMEKIERETDESSREAARSETSCQESSTHARTVYPSGSRSS